MSDPPNAQPQSSSQPSAALKSQTLDLAISLHLHAWPALTVAVNSSWGGPASSSKRDWFAGAVSDYLASAAPLTPPPSSSSASAVSNTSPSSSVPTTTTMSTTALRELQEDLEVLLLQVMEDEFDARIEDDSEVPVAEAILRSWRLCAQGDFGEVERLYAAWKAREERRSGGGAAAAPVEVREVVEEGEWGEDGDDDDDDDEDEEGGVDVEMQDAPPPREKQRAAAPEVDEEGFTKVVGKKRR